MKNKFITNLLSAFILLFLPAAGAESPDATFDIKIGETKTWAPFEELGKGDNTFAKFKFSNSKILTQKNLFRSLQFTGKDDGETTVTATCEGKTASARIRVSAPTAGPGSVAYYVNCIVNETKPLTPEKRGEYFEKIAEYVALNAAAHKGDRTLRNMAQAAALLAPTTQMLNNYATLLMAGKQHKEALGILENAAAAGNPILLTNIAECHYELGNYPAALSFAGRAAGADPYHGLPWLIQTCVHLKNGNNEKAVETLFKSYRSLWNDTTARLTSELKKQIMETAREKGRMLLTGEHIKLLYEACRAGGVPDGRDIPANQLALPYPVNPADALVAGESWHAAGAGIREENSKTNGPFQLYAGLYCEKDERQARCLDFLMLYYEWNIEKESEKQGKTLSEKNRELERQFNSKFAPQRNEIEEALKKEKAEIQKGFQTGLVATIGGSPETAKKNALNAQERQRNYPVFEAKLHVELYTQIVSEWDRFLLRKADAQKEIYEKEMKPWLEEYWLRVNAMLGYVEDANVRAAYGKKALWTINQNALVHPLVTAGFDAGVVNEKRRELNRWKNVLESAGARAEMLKQQEARARAKSDLAEQQKQAILQKQKESWDGDFTIKLPLDMGLMGISVSIGMEKGNLKFGYGAFEHEFVHSYNGDGTFGYTAITRASVLPTGLGELSTAANELKDVLEAGSGLKYLAGKANPIGNIPSFDRKIGTGKTYLYDQTGKLVDVVTIRETTTSAGWGPLGASQTTGTTTRQSVFGTAFSTKKDVSFGPFTLHE